ncbi:hypothetical protein ACFFX0_17125 [Citricoccus parietis]|uniref:Uncharacterized protein n=1 Tax=Citricoccus parietis TaxID=592307 RepID=A0ABV5G2E0_9MICC
MGRPASEDRASVLLRAFPMTPVSCGRPRHMGILFGLPASTDRKTVFRGWPFLAYGSPCGSLRSDLVEFDPYVASSPGIASNAKGSVAFNRVASAHNGGAPCST